MCGIAGVLSFTGNTFEIDERYLLSMRETMIHRGPDGAGLWISRDRKAGLAHRRLAIVDLSSQASQPMSNEDGTIWISFNGEIYNHLEIRKELIQKGGHNWKTDHSDTEVIIRAFEEWGIACLERFRGMFAFAIWDDRKKELWLVRDRIGIKPLYYSIHHGRIVFASEIKALLQDKMQERKMDEEALYHYLSFLVAPAPNTLFEGIKKLPGGTWMKVTKDGRIQLKEYWDVWDHTLPLDDKDEDEIADMLIGRLRESVHLRKMSDVPVGVFLSGGIDSSTNAALFAENEAKPVRTFSIGYDKNYKSYPNELGFARMMSRAIGSEHHEFLIDQDCLTSFLKEMVYLQDEPIADPVCVPVYYVSKLAKNHGVTVCQVGEGADELFCGYPKWQKLLKLGHWNKWPVPHMLKRGLLGALSVSGKKEDVRYELLSRAVDRRPIFWGGAEGFTHIQKTRLLSDRLKQKFKNYSSWEVIRPIHDAFQSKAKDQSDLNWMSYLDLKSRLSELLLMRVDKMSMGASVECRVPFLDHKFVELAMSIPAHMKTKNNTLKYILKKSVNGIIPQELIDRKKQGFGVPIYEWAFEELYSLYVREVNSLVNNTGVFNQHQVAKLLVQKKSQQLWALLNLALWHKRFIEN